MYLSCTVCKVCLMEEDTLIVVGNATCCKKCEHACAHYIKLKNEAHQQYVELSNLSNIVEEFLLEVSDQVLDNKEIITCNVRVLNKLLDVIKENDKKLYLMRLLSKK